MSIFQFLCGFLFSLRLAESLQLRGTQPALSLTELGSAKDPTCTNTSPGILSDECMTIRLAAIGTSFSTVANASANLWQGIQSANLSEVVLNALPNLAINSNLSQEIPIAMMAMQMATDPAISAVGKAIDNMTEVMNKSNSDFVLEFNSNLNDLTQAAGDAMSDYSDNDVANANALIVTANGLNSHSASVHAELGLAANNSNATARLTADQSTVLGRVQDIENDGISYPLSVSQNVMNFQSNLSNAVNTFTSASIPAIIAPLKTSAAASINSFNTVGSSQIPSVNLTLNNAMSTWQSSFNTSETTRYANFAKQLQAVLLTPINATNVTATATAASVSQSVSNSSTSTLNAIVGGNKNLQNLLTNMRLMIQNDTTNNVKGWQSSAQDTLHNLDSALTSARNQIIAAVGGSNASALIASQIANAMTSVSILGSNISQQILDRSSQGLADYQNLQALIANTSSQYSVLFSQVSQMRDFLSATVGANTSANAANATNAVNNLLSSLQAQLTQATSDVGAIGSNANSLLANGSSAVKSLVDDYKNNPLGLDTIFDTGTVNAELQSVNGWNVNFSNSLSSMQSTQKSATMQSSSAVDTMQTVASDTQKLTQSVLNQIASQGGSLSFLLGSNSNSLQKIANNTSGGVSIPTGVYDQANSVLVSFQTNSNSTSLSTQNGMSDSVNQNNEALAKLVDEANQLLLLASYNATELSDFDTSADALNNQLNISLSGSAASAIGRLNPVSDSVNTALTNRLDLTNFRTDSNRQKDRIDEGSLDLAKETSDISGLANSPALNISNEMPDFASYLQSTSSLTAQVANASSDDSLLLNNKTSRASRRIQWADVNITGILSHISPDLLLNFGNNFTHFYSDLVQFNQTLSSIYAGGTVASQIASANVSVLGVISDFTQQAQNIANSVATGTGGANSAIANSVDESALWSVVANLQNELSDLTNFVKNLVNQTTSTIYDVLSVNGTQNYSGQLSSLFNLSLASTAQQALAAAQLAMSNLNDQVNIETQSRQNSAEAALNDIGTADSLIHGVVADALSDIAANQTNLSQISANGYSNMNYTQMIQTIDAGVQVQIPANNQALSTMSQLGDSALNETAVALTQFQKLISDSAVQAGSITTDAQHLNSFINQFNDEMREDQDAVQQSSDSVQQIEGTFNGSDSSNILAPINGLTVSASLPTDVVANLNSIVADVYDMVNKATR